MKVLIRSINEFDLEEVCQHLLVVGDLTGDCYNCRELGLDYSKVNQCPKCKTEFRYIASRKSKQNEVKIFTSLKKKRLDLQYIEFNDLRQHKSREIAKDFLS